MTTLLFKVCAYGVCEGVMRLYDDGFWLFFFLRGSSPGRGDGLSATELFNQEEDHILVNVYLPVVIN